MREPFAPVPSGPVGLGRGYLDRLQRAASRGSAGAPSLAYPGRGDDSTLMGQSLIPDPERWLFARITAQPGESGSGTVGSGSGDPPCTATGYSWTEVRPGPCGTWVDPPDDDGLSGDNGGDPALPVRNPAFEANGDQGVAVGTVVLLFRGSQHGGADQDYPGQEYVFWAGAGAGADDPSGGFWALLYAQPGAADPLTGSAEDCGSGMDCPSQGYVWRRGYADACGLIREMDVCRCQPVLTAGGHCDTVPDSTLLGPAFEVNGRLDVPLFQPDGRRTAVWLRRAQDDPCLGCDGSPPLPARWLFEYATAAEDSSCDGSGSGCCGIPVSALFDCASGSIRDACIAVVGGKLVLQAADGTVLAGG